MHGPETDSTPGRPPPQHSADALRRSTLVWQARLRPEEGGLETFRILESGIQNSKAISRRVVPQRASRGTTMRGRPAPGNAERSGLRTAFKKAWMPTTPSRRMDEVVSEIVPHTQPAFAHASRELRLGRPKRRSREGRRDNANSPSGEGCLAVAAPEPCSVPEAPRRRTALSAICHRQPDRRIRNRQAYAPRFSPLSAAHASGIVPALPTVMAAKRFVYILRSDTHPD